MKTLLLHVEVPDDLVFHIEDNILGKSSRVIGLVKQIDQEREWTSVEEELPKLSDDGLGGKESDTVLVYDTFWVGIYTAYYGTDCDGFAGDELQWHVVEPKGKSCRELKGVTHWMPLPERPKVKP